MGIFQRCSLKHFHRWLLLGVLGAAALPCAAQTLPEFKYNLVDIGSLGGTYITPSQINNLGEVVGTAWVPGGQVRAFVYSGGVLSDLGAFGQVNSRGYGINDSSTIVGGALVMGRTT